jgi:hypothetical protein
MLRATVSKSVWSGGVSSVIPPTLLSMFPIWLGYTVFARSGRDTMMVFHLTEIVRQRHLLDLRQRLEFNPMHTPFSRRFAMHYCSRHRVLMQHIASES